MLTQITWRVLSCVQVLFRVYGELFTRYITLPHVSSLTMCTQVANYLQTCAGASLLSLFLAASFSSITAAWPLIHGIFVQMSVVRAQMPMWRCTCLERRVAPESASWTLQLMTLRGARWSWRLCAWFYKVHVQRNWFVRAQSVPRTGACYIICVCMQPYLLMMCSNTNPKPFLREGVCIFWNLPAFLVVA